MSEEINKEISEYPKETELANFYLDAFGNLTCSLNIDFRNFSVSLESYNQGDETYSAKEYEKVYYEVAKLCNESKEYEIDIYNSQIAVRTKEEKEQVRYETKTEKEKEEYLEELKQVKRDEINQARDKTEQGGFEYLGKIFDSDQVSCIRMMGARDALALAPETVTITWTCQDNTTIELNHSQLVGLVNALATWSNTCHQKASELKAQINAATSIEELNSITWTKGEING